MKTAYVISGGGARGAFSLGAMMSLHEQGIVPDMIYGTSVGAINAFGYIYCGLQVLNKVWTNLRPSDVMRFNFKTLLMQSDGVYSLDPLMKTMVKNSRELPLGKACAVSVGLETGDIRYSYSEEMSKYEFIRACGASSAIPAVFSPVDGHVDGGCKEIAPLKKAISDGYDDIYVILNSPTLIPVGKIGNFIQNGYRALSEILLNEIIMNDIRACRNATVHIIKPDNVFVDTLDFKNTNGIAKSILHGRESKVANEPAK